MSSINPIFLRTAEDTVGEADLTITPALSASSSYNDISSFSSNMNQPVFSTSLTITNTNTVFGGSSSTQIDTLILDAKASNPTYFPDASSATSNSSAAFSTFDTILGGLVNATNVNSKIQAADLGGVSGKWYLLSEVSYNHTAHTSSVSAPGFEPQSLSTTVSSTSTSSELSSFDSPDRRTSAFLVLIDTNQEIDIGLGRKFDSNLWSKEGANGKIGPLGNNAFLSGTTMRALGVTSGAGQEVGVHISIIAMFGKDVFLNALPSAPASFTDQVSNPDEKLSSDSLTRGETARILYATGSISGPITIEFPEPFDLIADPVTLTVDDMVDALQPVLTSALEISINGVVEDGSDSPSGKWQAALGNIIMMNLQSTIENIALSLENNINDVQQAIVTVIFNKTIEVNPDLVTSETNQAFVRAAIQQSQIGISSELQEKILSIASLQMNQRALLGEVILRDKFKVWVNGSQKDSLAALSSLADEMSRSAGWADFSVTSILSTSMQTTQYIIIFITNIMVMIVVVLSILGAVLLYALAKNNAEEKTFELGMLRALGMRARSILGILLLQTASFALPGWGLGLLAAWVISVPISELIGTTAVYPMDFTLSGIAAVVGICLGLLAPAIMNYIPIKDALSLSLRDSLDASRATGSSGGSSSSSENRAISPKEALSSWGVEPAQVAASLVLIVVGVIVFFVVPQAFLNLNYSVLLTALNIMLLGMLFGLVLLASAIMGLVQHITMFIFYLRWIPSPNSLKEHLADALYKLNGPKRDLTGGFRAKMISWWRRFNVSWFSFWSSTFFTLVKCLPFLKTFFTMLDCENRLLSLSASNLQGHGSRNRLASIMFSLSIAFLVFAGAALDVVGNGAGQALKSTMGADIVCSANSWASPLPEADLRDLLEYLKNPSNENDKLISSYSFSYFSPSKGLEYFTDRTVGRSYIPSELSAYSSAADIQSVDEEYSQASYFSEFFSPEALADSELNSKPSSVFSDFVIKADDSTRFSVSDAEQLESEAWGVSLTDVSANPYFQSMERVNTGTSSSTLSLPILTSTLLSPADPKFTLSGLLATSPYVITPSIYSDISPPLNSTEYTESVTGETNIDVSLYSSLPQDFAGPLELSSTIFDKYANDPESKFLASLKSQLAAHARTSFTPFRYLLNPIPIWTSVNNAGTRGFGYKQTGATLPFHFLNLLGPVNALVTFPTRVHAVLKKSAGLPFSSMGLSGKTVVVVTTKRALQAALNVIKDVINVAANATASLLTNSYVSGDSASNTNRISYWGSNNNLYYKSSGITKWLSSLGITSDDSTSTLSSSDSSSISTEADTSSGEVVVGKTPVSTSDTTESTSTVPSLSSLLSTGSTGTNREWWTLAAYRVFVKMLDAGTKEDRDAVANGIRSVLLANNMNTVTVNDVIGTVQDLEQVTSIMQVFFLFVSLVALILSFYLLYLSFSASIYSGNTSELGTYRSMGLRRSQIIRVYIYEATSLTLGAAILGLIVGLGLAFTLSAQFSIFLDIPVSVPFPLAMFLILFLGGIAVAVYGAWRPTQLAMKQPIANLVRGG